MKLISLILLLTTGCAVNRYVGPDLVPSESPCLDGTIVNIDAAGCHMFYWGIRFNTLKVRCTTGDDLNFWTTSSFFAIPHGDKITPDAKWNLYCTDDFVSMYHTTQQDFIQKQTDTEIK